MSKHTEKSEKAPLLIVTATFQEMRAVLTPFGERPDMELTRPASCCYQGRRFVLLVTGIGSLNAAMSLGKVLGSGMRVRGVVNLGIGGSFDPVRIPLLGKVAVQEEYWPEIGVRTKNGIDVQALKQTLGEGQGDLIRDHLVLHPEEKARAMGLELPADWTRVRSLSVAGVTGDAAEAIRIAGVYGVQCENMEGFSLAWVCYQEQIPFLEARSISNKVGSRDKEDWNIKGSLRVLEEMSRALICSKPKSVLV
ncbi:MAG: futalosine hydrolase [Desulfohalobiaceae bacterium]|nr:futalosine hydrolase [Desulfohalobiaceae bacterium]